MGYSIEDLDDQNKFKLILRISYYDLVAFVLDHLKKRSPAAALFWLACLLFLIIAFFFRIKIAGSYSWLLIFFHSLTGFIVLPVLFIPIHEGLHIIPYYLSGARSIRIGMDLKQYLFYVTAHKFVVGQRKFKIIAVFPFLLISLASVSLLFFLPGLWQWSLAAFLFAHASMCAGDFALLSFYSLNKDKKIYTWDDADKKEAYFYEKLSPQPSTNFPTV